MLQPKRTKYRKAQKGKMKGISQRGHRLSNGMFGIKSLESKFITSRQIEAARRALVRYIKRGGNRNQSEFYTLNEFTNNIYLYANSIPIGDPNIKKSTNHSNRLLLSCNTIPAQPLMEIWRKFEGWLYESKKTTDDKTNICNAIGMFLQCNQMKCGESTLQYN